MSVEAETPVQQTSEEGKKYRLVVKSAEEAVRVIRDKLGATARVLSVRQLDGQGLSKFISSPKLEVVVEVPGSGSSGDDVPGLSSSETDLQPLPEKEEQKEDATPNVETEADNLLNESVNITSLLERAGFDRDFITTDQAWPRWQSISEMSIPEALNEISLALRDRFREIEPRPATGKVAFFGLTILRTRSSAG